LRGNPSYEIYEATKKAWLVGRKKSKTTKYALSEHYRIVIKVFEIHKWYETETPHSKRKNVGVLMEKLQHLKYEKNI
jgi:hypothetical protein